MRKPVIAVLTALSLVLPGMAHAATPKAVVKAGVKCTKAGVTAKVGSTFLLCKKNSKKVLVWTKTTKECFDLTAQNALSQKSIKEIQAQLPEARRIAEAMSDSDPQKIKSLADIEQMEKDLPGALKVLGALSDAAKLFCS